MTKLTATFTLKNGIKIPKIGFGTWQMSPLQAEQAVAAALKIGYRHIDTALVYNNEAAIGKAIKESKIDRTEIFVTSKLPAETKSYQKTWNDFETTLENLQLDYLDLYLIHAPQPWSQAGQDYDEANQEVWRAMEEIYASGQVKAIGVSNFNVHDLQNILENAIVEPMVDQIQYYVGYTEPEITQFAQAHQILVEAWSPLATGGLLKNPQLQQIADNYQVSLAQLAIQFCVQNRVLPLPKAVHKEHIRNNSQLDFTISEKDMEQLNTFTDSVGRNHWHFH